MGARSTDKTIPKVDNRGGGLGVSAQRRRFPDYRPMVNNLDSGGIGVSAQRKAMGGATGAALTAPFPWYGGKRRWAPRIWERFGEVGVYVEPFAGSLAVLLHRETPAPREIVCDLDGGICNFWRALKADPEAVAYWADWPTIHQDLTARHRWLVQWVVDNRERLQSDPDYCDAKAAGWWVWGISLWIGGGWCQPAYRGKDEAPERRPHVQPHSGGEGVSVQAIHNKRPRVQDDNGGVGVSAQRGQMPAVADWNGGMGVSAQRVSGKIPKLPSTGTVGGVHRRPSEKRPRIESQLGGNGVSAQRQARPDLIDWFNRLANRLAGVVVLNRSWQSALTPSLLQQTATGPKPPVGILMDPPYLQDERDADIYGSDAVGTSNASAAESWAWAQANGERFRIAYCAHVGDVEVPAGWTVETQSFAGIRDPKRRERLDMVLFSPACIAPPQGSLW